MADSADPDKLASSEKSLIWTEDLELYCLQK